MIPMTIPILNGNSLSQNGILVAIAVTLVVAVGGAVLAPSPESVATILGLCAVVITNLIGMLKQDAAAAKQEIAAAKIDVAAAKVDEVKTALIASDKNTAAVLTNIAVTGEKTHTLVNSNMGVQLTISAVALRRVADLTHEPEDVAAAELAERGLAEHISKQAIVDSGESTS